MNPRVLIIDDEELILRTIKRKFVLSGIKDVRTESDPRRAIDRIREKNENFDLAVIDLNMPHLNGVDVLDWLKSHSPETECVMISAMDEVRAVVKCLRKGAYDYIVKPINGDELINSCKNALERKNLLEIVALSKNRTAPEVKNRRAFKSIKTRCDEVLKILKEAELHAASDVPVLITGESGTGKELLARAVHAASSRAGYPFTPVNMASVNENLFESEFFGHVRGSFTGAERERAGYLEKTNGGTLFLDEIGILSQELQAKLLRILQEGDYFKIGTDTPRKINIRFVAATNENLEKLAAEGKFRKDLYYRLRGAWMHLPPLQDRSGDISLLIEVFLKKFSMNQTTPRISPDALNILKRYDFPGNIRELKSIIQSSVNLCKNGELTVEALPGFLTMNRPRKVSSHSERDDSVILPLCQVEKNHILATYKATDGNKLQTARLLGICPNTLRNKLKSYGRK